METGTVSQRSAWKYFLVMNGLDHETQGVARTKTFERCKRQWHRLQQEHWQLNRYQKRSVGQLLKLVSGLMMRNMEKTNTLRTLSIPGLYLTCKLCSYASQESLRKRYSTLSRGRSTKDELVKLGLCSSVEQDGMHLSMLRKLFFVTVQ